MSSIFESDREVELADGITLRVKWQYDEDGDMSDLGTFTNQRGAWTVDRKTGQLLDDYESIVKHLPPAKADAWCDTMEELGYDVTAYDSAMRGWWECHASGYRIVRDDLPTYYDPREYRYFKLADVHGYNPPADENEIGYLVQDYQRAHDYTRDYWWYMGCIVTIEADGVEVGYDSLWGIESDSGDDYRLEVERDCIASALRSVDGKADKMRATADRLAALDVDALVNALTV